MRFRAAAASALISEPLDLLTAIFHRPSGTTHLLAEPAPEILAALGERAMDLAALTEALGDRYELGGDAGVLAERLEELVAAGLVERA